MRVVPFDWKVRMGCADGTVNLNSSLTPLSAESNPDVANHILDIFSYSGTLNLHVRILASCPGERLSSDAGEIHQMDHLVSLQPGSYQLWILLIKADAS